MVLLVDVLVEQPVVEETMGPVVPEIFQNKEKGPLLQHGGQSREGHGHGNAQRLAHRMEGPDRNDLHNEVRLQHRLQTLPLLLVGRNVRLLDLPFAEVWDLVDDVPGQTSAKIEHLVREEEKQARGEDVVVDVRVPRRPQLLQDVQLRLRVLNVCEHLYYRRCGDRLHNGGVEYFGHLSALESNRGSKCCCDSKRFLFKSFASIRAKRLILPYEWVDFW